MIGGTRVPKHHVRIEAYGTVDELNSHVGLLSTYAEAAEFEGILKEIQDRLFTLGSHLAMEPGKHMALPDLVEEDVLVLERWMDEMDAVLPPLKNFVLAGGHGANAQAHVARCVCRRAERGVVHLAESEEVEGIVLRYLNRLSDWLFVFARVMSVKAGVEEVVWAPRGK